MGEIAQERLEYNQHQHPLENCLNITSPTPSTRLWLFSASPKEMCTWTMLLQKIKKNSIFLFLSKINRKSHILCVFFFSSHWELVISIYPCPKKRAEVAWDTILPEKQGQAQNFAGWKLLRKQITHACPSKMENLGDRVCAWKRAWPSWQCWAIEWQTQPFCIADVSSFEIISRSVRI